MFRLLLSLIQLRLLKRKSSKNGRRHSWRRRIFYKDLLSGFDSPASYYLFLFKNLFRNLMLRVCYCGAEFETNNPNKIHCSDKCRNIKKSRKYSKSHSCCKYEITCVICKKQFKGSRPNTKYCSPKCKGKSQQKYLNIPQCLKESNKKLDKNIGYVRVYCPMHPEANSRGYVYEHRLVAEEKIGRRLKKGEIVHHKNGLRWDNNPENLEIMTASEHSKLSSRR